MSRWNPNYEGPYTNQGQMEYSEDAYNNPIFGITTDPYFGQRSYYDFNGQFAQNFTMQVPPPNYPDTDGGDRTNTFPRSSQLLSYNTIGGLEPPNAQAQSSTVLNSNLTPLAKEFKPSSSMSNNVVQPQVLNDVTRNQGAIRKGGSGGGAYWNRDKNYRKESKPPFHSNQEYYNENRYQKQNNVGAVSKFNQTGHFRNGKDFNKSSEQNKILQETKEFLQQVKNINDNKGKDEELQRSSFETNPQNDLTKNNRDYDRNKIDYNRSKNDSLYTENSKSNTNSNKNSYYTRNVYNNRRKGYKNSYKKEYNVEFDDKNKEIQGNSNTGRKYEDEQPKEKSRGQPDRKEQEDERKRDNENEKKKFAAEYYSERKSSERSLRKKLDAASQRERLEQLVTRRMLECLVCCEKLRHTDEIWSCKQCFHILHLQCTKRWAQSSKLEAGWRCPACQNVYQDIPKDYRCYCGKQTDPAPETGATPHSCGELCARKGRACAHKCTLICHPGPCPDCTAMVPRHCGCGATQPTIRCSSTIPITCKNICAKTLNCGIHKCAKKCHGGDCNPCNEEIKQECYCGKVGRKIKCSAEAEGLTTYECGDVCEKMLSCGNHKCERNCHAGPCQPCALDPNQISTCPCGHTKLTQQRHSCMDPIPCCEKICNKKLFCGQPNAPHRCVAPCHDGACPPCSRTTIMRCRCGHMDKEIPCTKVTTKADDARCEKKCTKKRLCGKHKCNQLCCIEADHICPLLCNRQLSCGQHRCEEPCHKGRCRPCWRTSFEELYCECGSSVLYPPVACGTRPPPCDQPCSRIRSCGHEALHNCHTGPCPPCTVLTKRWCHGQHEQRSAIPCYQENFSCGLPCGHDLPCGRHKCIQACHADFCHVPCTQPCGETRNLCGHPCNLPCHDPPCPETSCKQSVKVTCQCGLRKSNRVCMELIGEYQSMAMSQLASKMEEMQSGHAVDITDIVGGQKRTTLKTLECNDECRIIERNRRLAIGLQIRNPDLSAKLTPRYSDYMRNWAKKDRKFCQAIHDKLTELVQLAKQSKQKSRSYSFESMNRDKRHFVHEYCEHFGCDSAAYDPEPNRNVVATAFKEKSWLPSYSLLEVIQRESGQRKVPGPQQLSKGTTGTKSEAVALKLPGRIPRPTTPPGEYVDYFNNPPE